MSQPLTACPPLTDERPRRGDRRASPFSHIRHGFLDDEFFHHQPSTRTQLPDPQPLLENLARCVIEVLSGSRDIDQIARWVNEDVYRHLLKRVVLATRARRAKGETARRIPFTIGRTITSEPRDGVIEAVVMVHNKVRSRAVAIRLEGLDNRWRATIVSVL